MALYFTNYSTWRVAPGISLEDLFVRPEYRGKGYGTLLLRQLAKETKMIGGKRLEWSVLNWNEPSIRFYEGIGATMMSEWVSMRVDGEALQKIAGDGCPLRIPSRFLRITSPTSFVHVLDEAIFLYPCFNTPEMRPRAASGHSSNAVAAATVVIKIYISASEQTRAC